MVQVSQFFNKPVPSLSIIVRMARIMLPCHFVSIIVHEMLKICHRKDTEEGDNKQWGKLSRDSGILAKRGAGAKIILFANFFCGTHFCVRREASN